MTTKQQVPNQFLRLLSGGKNLVLEALDGKSIITKNKVLRPWVESGLSKFERWGLSNAGKATKMVKVDVYEIVGDVMFPQIFLSNNAFNSLDNVCMTQSQIIKFCEKYPSWLRQDEHATFFLIKENDEYFVVYVYVKTTGLFADVYRFWHGSTWFGEFRPRAVIPQSMPY